MSHTAELKRFITSQYVYSGTRIALSIVIPGIILAYFGLLKDYFLFPLATSFVGLADMPGPFIRRRNAMVLSIMCFMFVAIIASILKDYPVLIYLEIIVFGMFFTMIGVYGQRFASIGGLTLVVFSIFVDGHLTGANAAKSLFTFFAGCVWFLLVYLTVSKIQPYKLASQMIGENYHELAEYLKIKAKFYKIDANFDELNHELIGKQVVIKNLQEDTREVVFKTRQLVNESTTQSRLLMLMFLNSIDFYEKLMTSDQDYQKLHKNFDHTPILEKIHNYLLYLAEEINHIGIAIQSGQKATPMMNINEEIQKVHDAFFDLRVQELSSENMEDFMMLRMTLARIKEVTEDVKTIYTVFSQDQKLAKSLSTGLDYEKFVPKQEKLNSKIFLNNFSIQSGSFRHAVRITFALLLGYGISQLQFLGIGHSYWILITIIAIMRPAYSTTKHRNLLRLYGTVAGAILAYIILTQIQNEGVLLGILFASMILCFALLKDKYAWSVFFMTIYIFITFNFLNPGNVNQIFKDRIIDTLIAGGIAFFTSYFILPLWEHTQNIGLMRKSAEANLTYLRTVFDNISKGGIKYNQEFKLTRKDAVISLANLSDNFQRMLSDPKNQQKKMEIVHQFVNTSHLTTAYIASLSQYSNYHHTYPEIDLSVWNAKISAEMQFTIALLGDQPADENLFSDRKLVPSDTVDVLLQQRKNELQESEVFDVRDPQRLTYLTQLKNVREILELIMDVVHEQRKVSEKYRELKS